MQNYLPFFERRIYKHIATAFLGFIIPQILGDCKKIW